jgi:competence ComEA-like helix-hairpin-helix protein
MSSRMYGRMFGWIASASFLAPAYLGAPSLAFAAPLSQAVDPADQAAVQVVCGRCHSTDVFANSPRSWSRWNEVFAQMTAHGARGTDEELVSVTRYFLENLTLVNINTSPAEELAPVLGVSQELAEAIIERRAQQKFSTLADLAAIPGIDRERLERLKGRILF